MHIFIVKTSSGHSIPTSKGRTNPRAFSPASVQAWDAVKHPHSTRARRHVVTGVKLVALFIEHFAINAEAVTQAVKPHDTAR